MTHLTIRLSVALFTFALGTLISLVLPIASIKQEPKEPLRVTVSPERWPGDSKASFPHYIVTVQNVSGRTVRGYSLGHTCNCRSWDSDNHLYPEGVSFTNPVPEHQVLRPGETQEMPFDLDGPLANGSRPRVWADLVHFEKGSNWGPNQSHKEGYVRE